MNFNPLFFISFARELFIFHFLNPIALCCFASCCLKSSRRRRREKNPWKINEPHCHGASLYSFIFFLPRPSRASFLYLFNHNDSRSEQAAARSGKGLGANFVEDVQHVASGEELCGFACRSCLGRKLSMRMQRSVCSGLLQAGMQC
jgi:hypothetical protein